MDNQNRDNQNRENQLKVMAKDVHYNEVRELTHEDFEHNFLRGDAIDATTRGSVDDYELDRLTASREDEGYDSLAELPMTVNIQEPGNDGMVQNATVNRDSYGRGLEGKGLISEQEAD
ncbi:hypothetical protein [Tumebacillus flagellatus]|uniref:Uncharacterized protein n=1 Tax=Tumebacillus flagellatus TaxID=1157490 RepID=A0A074LQE7_9BACL|nr:hypothetical protein [Tumebacillus flagellatus]KEO82053.1 hypothetical protein EL26_17235 [Tumebacillus flagellatus]